ncbi:MAG: VWA domain-containing protein [Terriglobales bacterium]
MAVPRFRFPSVFAASFAFVLLTLCATQAVAQQVHLEPRAADTVKNAADKDQLPLHLAPIRVDVGLVLVPVTVTDSMNRPVMGLNKQDFTLSEGTQSQEIRYFSAQDSPLSVGILLDVSASMKDKIELVRDALTEFLNDSHPDDDYFVVTFSDRPQIVADVTQSIGTIRARLAQVTPSGHTALLDAIYLGVQKLKHARYQRKALLIISDGGDNHSRFTAGELKALVMETDVQIYGIGIYSAFFHTPEEWSGKHLLTEITEATGGRTITIGNARQLPQAASDISTELRNQYMLGYAPKEQPSSVWRNIKVSISRRENGLPLHLFWRKGYQDPGQ